jgi:hypothetical protein
VRAAQRDGARRARSPWTYLTTPLISGRGHVLCPSSAIDP